MFKSLYKETEGFRLVSILTPLCMIGEVVMEMIIPKLMSSIIDDGVTAGNLSHIYRIGGWMIVAAAFGLLFGVLGGVLGARASTGYARNLRRSMYRNIQTFSFANIDKYSTAGLVTRMTTDVTNIQNAYQMILRMAIRAPSSMVIAMIMAFTINAKLASIYLVAVIILGGCLVLALGAWAWTSVLGLAVFADELSDVPAANLALLLVAQLAISLTPLSLAFMLSRLGLREQGLNAAGNIGGMVLTFLGGAWVPLSLMSEEVRTVAHFVPTYWVSDAVTTLLGASALTASDLARVGTDIGVATLFAVAIAALGLALSRTRRA